MDTLDRQQGEKFHTWAKRTQEYMQFYYRFSYITYPKSNRVVNDYIGCIRRLRTELNLYRCDLCKEWWNQGHNEKTYLKIDICIILSALVHIFIVDIPKKLQLFRQHLRA